VVDLLVVLDKSQLFVGDDYWSWKISTNGVYSVRLAHDTLRGGFRGAVTDPGFLNSGGTIYKIL